MIHPRATEKLYGQQAALKTFLDAFNSGNLHHAWLLVGEEGIGKATFAYTAAKFLLDKPRLGAEKLEVNHNSDIIKKICSQSHPDLFVLEKEEDENEIKVDAARGLADFTSLTSAMGDHKVIIIDSVNDLNNNAANSLLKLLEEPQDNTYFFLVCHSLSKLLPTIKSRCRQLKFLPLDFNDFYKILSLQKKLDKDAAKDIFDLCGGSMHYAKLLLQEEAIDIYKLTEDLIISDNRDFHSLQKLMSAVNDNDNWKVVRFAFHNTIHKLTTDAAKNYNLTERQMELAFKRLHLIQQADTFHLDRSQLMAAMLTIRSQN